MCTSKRCKGRCVCVHVSLCVYVCSKHPVQLFNAIGRARGAKLYIYCTYQYQSNKFIFTCQCFILIKNVILLGGDIQVTKIKRGYHIIFLLLKDKRWKSGVCVGGGGGGGGW